MIPQAVNKTYVVNDGEVTVYDREKNPEKIMSRYDNLLMTELFLMPISIVSLLQNVASPLVTVPLALLLTAVAVGVTYLCVKRYKTKFYDQHKNTTYKVPNEICTKLAYIDEPLRPEIANLLEESQTHPDPEKTQTFTKLINERVRITQLMNR